MRKRTIIALLGNLFGAIALILVLAWVVGAQGPEPGEREPPRGPHPVHPTGVRLDEKPALRPTPSGDLGAQDVSAAVDVGQPGLSFRYMSTFGVTQVAYPADSSHLNFPDGIFVDGGDNLWITERHGKRVLKFNSSGTWQMTLGQAGYRSASEDTFGEPADVAVDGSGNVWVVDREPDRVVKFDSSGNYLSQLGYDWSSGSDNAHFDSPRGVAFDSAGRIYVADTDNHRVQVFDSSGVYSRTLGVTGVSGSDNAHFNYPSHVTFDSKGNLYISDSFNHRIQIFDSNLVYSATLGSYGTGNYQFNYPWQVAIDSSDNVYVADTDNHRVQIFNSSHVYQAKLGLTGVSGSNNNTFNGPQGVAVDSAGNIYVSDQLNHRVQKFDSSYNYTATIGTTGVPYVTDNYHYFAPYGVAVDSSGNVIVAENMGYRVLKLNSSGVPQWAIGQAGVYGSDNTHFGDWWDGPVAVAVDSSDNAYVADAGNHRIQKCTSAGSCTTFAGVSGESGSDNTHFDRPFGVAVDTAGNVYVGDRENHRVQKCTPAGSCSTFAGVTGVSGSDNTHFNGPMGVTVDSSGNVFVADGWNNRVQKCTASGNCSQFAGTVGEWGDDFAHFSEPQDVAVDAQDRIYVADAWNNRVQVFDSSGAYLTTIGGAWGSSSGQLRGAMAVDLDSSGNVYVADENNARIQKFAPGVPGWEQVNINGFGHPSNPGVLSLASFKDYLYAGVDTRSGDNNRLWRKSDGEPWTAVITESFGLIYNHGIDHLIEFNDQLYASTRNWNWNVWETEGGEIWRSSNGLSWMRVVSQGFGDPTNGEVFRFAVFNDTLYASTWSYTDTHGTEIWRSSTGNAGDWARVVTNGFDGDTDNQCATTLEVFNGYLYAGTFNWYTGGEIWRTSNGTTWTQVNTDGFGDYDNDAIASFAVFNGYLYAGTVHDSTGGQMWRCSTASGCDANSDWTQVVSDGFGSTDNRSAAALVAFDNYLYCVTENYETGAEVWHSSTGDSGDWEQVGPDGFGDSNNESTNGDNSVAVFNDRLYIGTWNWANGGEVWQLAAGGGVYLPIILKSFSP